MSVTISLTVSCKEHPEYEGARRRDKRNDYCWGCSDVYNIRHPLGLVLDATIEKVEVQHDES